MLTNIPDVQLRMWKTMFSVSKEIKVRVKRKVKQNKKTYLYLQQNMESTKTEYTQQEQKCISDLNLKLHLI